MMRKLLGVMRAPFLLLVPACLAPAIAVSWQVEENINLLWLALIIVAALASHIAVNALNEYEDFRSGLDFLTQRTPFSGGSGTLVEHTDFAPMALYVGWLGVLVTGSIGLYFVAQQGLNLIAPGLIGLAIIVFYTRWINRMPLLCLLAPGLGFGLLMVNLSVLVLTGGYQPAGIAVSVPVTLLASNLLLLNQLPDVDADRRVGRRHLAVVRGVAQAANAYIMIGVLVYLSVAVAVVCGLLPTGALLSLLTLPLAMTIWRGLQAGAATEIDGLVPLMGRNVMVTLATPVLLAVGIAFF